MNNGNMKICQYTLVTLQTQWIPESPDHLIKGSIKHTILNYLSSQVIFSKCDIVAKPAYHS